MTTPRLRSLTLKGFRAYGAEQTLNLPSDIAAVWGPNSKGKTSLAEAFEFLLTGALSRREMLASSQDEFADALRNVHLPAGSEVCVSATIVDSTGAPHHVKRILVSDYAKKQDCQSRLEIDGVVCDQAGLSRIGVVLSQPPLAAPVLTQHTLSYIFSVRPQDRATYFKALLEVSDLDDLRNDISAAGRAFDPSDSALLSKLDKCAALPTLAASLGTLRTTIPSLAGLSAQLDSAIQALITPAGTPVPPTAPARITALEALLVERRAKTFPVTDFGCIEALGWNGPDAVAWSSLRAFLVERAKVDIDARRLIGLFGAVMDVPEVATLTHPIDCPVCNSTEGLTAPRVAVIRAHLENTKSFTDAETAAIKTLRQLAQSTDTLSAAATSILPRFLRISRKERHAAGFSIASLKALLGPRASELTRPWLADIRPMLRASHVVQEAARQLSASVDQQASAIETALDPAALQSGFEALATLRDSLESAVQAYRASESELLDGLNQVLDAKSETAGWQELLDLARQPSSLRTALVERKARVTLSKEIEGALKQIDHAKEMVLDQKFSEHSTSILSWWERLRPDEQTYFAEVKPRKGARRTIDFKAGLSPNSDRSAPQMRDVIAVFSQSQLHCLGLALFLARAASEGVGFIVLDDPVLSSDDDYRTHFNMTVLAELLNLPMQVIVLTQDHGTWQDIEIRYRHQGISTAQLYVDNPASGTIIENTSDVLTAKINRAKSLARGGHPDVRKECGVQLRDGSELFCKELLVKHEHSKGNGAAALSDYDGKILEWLAPHVEPLLTKDPSHQGKFGVLRNTVNRACHDNAPPGSAEMVQGCGELAHLAKVYLA